MLNRAGWLVLLALVGETVYELVDALGWGSWWGTDVVHTAAFFTLLATAGLAFVCAHRGYVSRIAALIAPAAGAYLLAFFFSYDSYFGSAVE